MPREGSVNGVKVDDEAQQNDDMIDPKKDEFLEESDSASRSRSRSESRFRSRSRRSRSPRSSRSRGAGTTSRYSARDDPEPSRCLGVFGLSLYTTERDLRELFSQYGEVEKVQLVFDHPTGRSRGFGFVYFDKLEDAIEAKEKLAGTEVDGHRVRVDYSITKRAHTPTPGIYMGTPAQTRGYGGYRGGRYDSRRSPSPYRSYRGGRYRDSPPRDYYGSMR
ncbi:unnamed protein product [Toxocara canis]|uniref:RRM domain-containing protein n=1 Tax=Toxocara canis TaxID=6265 RepID=A0A183UQD1_TOXCA|nr:unnamed protein product [Toxocara canis]